MQINLFYILNSSNTESVFKNWNKKKKTEKNTLLMEKLCTGHTLGERFPL